MSDLKRVWIVTGNIEYEGIMSIRVAGSKSKAEDIETEIKKESTAPDHFTDIEEYVVEY
jgi:hypothetical protein